MLIQDIPVDTELVEQLQEGCIWRRARGSATVVSGIDDVRGSSLQRRLVLLNNAMMNWIIFASLISPPESELNVEDDSTTSDVGFQDGKVCINCAVDTVGTVWFGPILTQY
ncbi:uncharacterized protein Pyn_14596 [Prunus yedoensis var. nudiflora]|uniref:Uncharacterized protein n=1 Tax=Prunus yedoensis var. nudiflora TaxID=2094558 RepID=A0A314XHC9_PRUYE|nr:uncharacterized protein Pyn_14596 [Prunus yedoensis var. nudiflora]